MTCRDAHAGLEAEAEIASSGRAIERSPSGRSYDLRKPWAVGLAARLGWAPNDSALIYARAGRTERFDTAESQVRVGLGRAF